MNLEQRNASLEERIQETDLPEAVKVLIKDAKKRKRQLIILAVSVFLDVLLSVGLYIGYRQNHNLAIKAEDNHSAIVRNCETSNEARANNKQLWTYILNLTPQQPTTPEQQQRVIDFKAFIDKTFAPRDCSNI